MSLTERLFKCLDCKGDIFSRRCTPQVSLLHRDVIYDQTNKTYSNFGKQRENPEVGRVGSQLLWP